MAAKDNITTTAQYTTAAREVDFVTRFTDNWDALRTIMGIMRPIRKAPGTKLVSYKASVDGSLNGGTVAEGEEIPFTKMKVEPVSYGDIEVKKYAKSVTIEAVAKYGAQVAVEKTDEAFLVALQNDVLTSFYTFLGTGSLAVTGATTWQKALALAKGKVLDKFAGMDKDVTEVVGFANIMDFYEYLGDKEITTQTQFGLTYVKDFLGYSTLFLLPEKYVAPTKVYATPVENIDLYYVDPADSDFTKMGLNYTVKGETNLIGVHVEGDYSRATGDMYAIMGMKLWAEYLDGIAVATVAGE